MQCRSHPMKARLTAREGSRPIDRIRCMKYRLEYSSTRSVRFRKSSVGTRILDKTSRFRSSTAAATVSFSDHDGISSSRNWRAFSAPMKDTPTRDFTVVVDELDHVRRAPNRSLSGPEISLSFPNIGCWYGLLLQVWYRIIGSVLRPRNVFCSSGCVSKSPQK
jgi:hypothetical protein